MTFKPLLSGETKWTLLLGGVGFSNLFFVLKNAVAPVPYFTIDQAQKAGVVTLNIGLFINIMINSLIIAFAVFLIVRSIKKLERKEESKPEPVKKYPYCLSSNDIAAKRFAHCTSQFTSSI